jgi:cephalosporin-C deacetylase-like acetyl esterase
MNIKPERKSLWRGHTKSVLAGMLSAICLCLGVADAAESPYAVLPAERVQTYPLTSAENEPLGTAALGWNARHLVVEASVRDATPVSLADVGVGIDEAYLADSVEFWVGRHQFVMAATPAGGQLWDYLYQGPVAGAETLFEKTPDGFRLRTAVPWEALGLAPKDGVSFPFALQVNDRQRVKDGERWKESGRQLLFPSGAVWDRPSTYGTVALAGAPAAGATPAPAAFASLDIRTYAYAQHAEAVVQRAPVLANSALRLICRGPDGAVLSEQPVPAGDGKMLLNLAWDEKQAGICTAELWLEAGGKRLGPVAEPYFCAGPTTIAKYRSPRQAPDDLAAFWVRKLAAMRARPLNAKATEVESGRPDVIVEKVTLDNHRGHPMIVWVSRKRADNGPRPAHLNVYPPMRDGTHVWPQDGHLGITFCGSLQGECRLPGQAKNEDLWARAETLDDCYWLDVVLDGIRAMDYVASRADSNGKVAVTGGSRGGWYSLALAAVAPDRVALASFGSPCYSDVTMNQRLGYGSAATEIYTTFERDRVMTGGKVFENFRYFDPLFLAELVRTRMVFSAGLQDNICSAIGMTAAANRMPKEFCTFVLDPEGGHGGSPWMGPITRLAGEFGRTRGNEHGKK